MTLHLFDKQGQFVKEVWWSDNLSPPMVYELPVYDKDGFQVCDDRLLPLRRRFERRSARSYCEV